MKIDQNLIDELTLTALQNGWSYKQFDTNTGMISFIKPVDKDGYNRINVFLTTLTVATAINHPKMGRNQLYRKGLNFNQIKKLFTNPRLHTGKGYRYSNEVK